LATGRGGTLPFAVDSALLKELGERLVGKPHIALAELVKNSYDADARKVVIRFAEGRIEVSDDGHGMTYDEFRNFWMRIGSPHKQRDPYSRELRRPLTGSKGVGRLAVQFLARRIELVTVAASEPGRELAADVDWDEAVLAGELTKAQARYHEREPSPGLFPGGSAHGTVLVLTKLSQEWDVEQFRGLAKEIWMLQPPFRSVPELAGKEESGFAAELLSSLDEAGRAFAEQMAAPLTNCEARLVGELRPAASHGERMARVTVEFRDGERIKHEYPIPNCALNRASFEIRVFRLRGRQKRGLAVGNVRDYFEQFGGVHVYDAGFHLPYYGPDTDWLHIEYDHSHRRTLSALLPEGLQIPRGLNFLPTQGRLFGVVHVNTALEHEAAVKADTARDGQYLKIQISRDRLVDNSGFASLRLLVRYALDYYAMAQARRALARKKDDAPPQTAKDAVKRVDEVLDGFREDMPPSVFCTLRDGVRTAIQVTDEQEEVRKRERGLLCSLATAGMGALAFDHELARQLQVLRGVEDQLRKTAVCTPTSRAESIRAADGIREWVERARALRGLFVGLRDEETRSERRRYKARVLLAKLFGEVQPVLRGVVLSAEGVPPDLQLPEGSYAEWSALLQNVLTNAYNAMIDSRVRKVSVRSSADHDDRSLVIEDTGCGVDLATAAELFEPFVRKLEISPERRQLGLGGTGLGLTIVRMLAGSLECRVGFVEPGAGFSTALAVTWSEEER